MDPRMRSVAETYPFGRQKRTFSTMAESHRAESPASSLFIPHNEHMAQRARLSSSLALPSRFHPPRFPGDGLDFRSPVTYRDTPAAEIGNNTVIDLTDDVDSQGSGTSTADQQRRHTPVTGSSHAQRLPRYTRDIIGIPIDDDEDDGDDVDEEEDEGEAEAEVEGEQEEGADTRAPVDTPVRSEPWFDGPGHRLHRLGHAFHDAIRDEVQFIETRPRPSTTTRDIPGFPDGLNPDAMNPIDLTADMDDDLVYQHTRPRIGESFNPPMTGIMDLLGDNAHYLQRTLLNTNFLEALQQQSRRDHMMRRREAERQQPRTQHGQPGLGDLDYNHTAFNLWDGTSNRRPSTKYVPPENPATGFTRSPGEDEVVVCPNCGDELAMGESELKQQIWVIKACGHVYCGECAQSNVKATKQTSRKGKGRAAEAVGPESLKKSSPPSTQLSRVPSTMNRPEDSQKPPKGSRKSQSLGLRSLYLILYNAVSAVLWSRVLLGVASITLSSGYHDTYAGIAEYTKWVQTLAGLEVLHAAVGIVLPGIVRAPLLTTVMQVASRFMLVWGIAAPFPASTASSPAYSSMLVAWSATEIIRYSYFAINLAMGGVPGFLTWLRYNTFFVLYPLGISSECWLVWLATGPAKARFGDLADWVLKAVLLIYVPGSYILFTHMMAQRRKIMRAGKEKKKR